MPGFSATLTTLYHSIAGSLENMKSTCFSSLQTARSGAAVKDDQREPRSGLAP